MTSQILTILRRERKRLLTSVEAIDQLLELWEKGGLISPEELSLIFQWSFSQHEKFAYPYFGKLPDKIVFALKLIGRFCRKEEIIVKLQNFSPDENHDQVATVLSRMVGDARLVSLKYNNSNLYVFYGLPSFVDLDKGTLNKGLEPISEDMKELRIKSVRLNCGGVLSAD